MVYIFLDIDGVLNTEAEWKRNKKIIKKLIPYISLFACIIFIYLACTSVVEKGAWINVVSGDSMYPTLEDGQIIFSDDAEEIRRGDIVTSFFPEYMEDRKEELLVKRVIGLPGEEVLIDETGVYINNQKLEEEYLTEQAKKTTYFTQSPISQKLQENEYFLMGDNRKISFDSRSFGVIKREQILYKQAEGVTKLFWRNTIMFVGVMIAAFILYGVLNVVFCELIRLQRRRCRVKCTKRSLDKNRT